MIKFIKKRRLLKKIAEMKKKKEFMNNVKNWGYEAKNDILFRQHMEQETFQTITYGNNSISLSKSQAVPLEFWR